MIDAGNQVPLGTNHLVIGILHLIAVDYVGKGMMTTHKGRRFECPQLAILGLHE